MHEVVRERDDPVQDDGSRLTQLTRGGSIEVGPSWSPDGKRIAFVSDRAGSPQIYVMDANGSWRKK